MLCDAPEIALEIIIWLLFDSQEFNIEKLHMLEAEKGRVRKDFERREGQVETKKKIEYSKQLNASRIRVGPSKVFDTLYLVLSVVLMSI